MTTLREQVAEAIANGSRDLYEVTDHVLRLVEYFILISARHQSVARAIYETPWQPSVEALHIRYGQVAVEAAWKHAARGYVAGDALQRHIRHGKGTGGAIRGYGGEVSHSTN